MVLVRCVYQIFKAGWNSSVNSSQKNIEIKIVKGLKICDPGVWVWHHKNKKFLCFLR
jgi:hypothetical protein